IVWFRVLGVVLKSNALTFGYLLGLYLAGVGCGSLSARHSVFDRLDARRAFLLLQAAVPIWAGCSFVVLVSIAGRTHFASPLWSYMASPGGAASPEALFFAHVCLPLFLIFPPTLMMGLSFGLLQRSVHTNPSLVGRRVGWLQSANILGATA